MTREFWVTLAISLLAGLLNFIFHLTFFGFDDVWYCASAGLGLALGTLFGNKLIHNINFIK